jgi:hypothetical protein
MRVLKATEINHARPERSARLDITDYNLSLLLFSAFSTIGAFKALPRSWDPGGFNVDMYFATATARHYLLRPWPDFRIHDLYTAGFVHPLLYVPILGLLRLLGIPSEAQDNLAIALVYASSLGSIVVLSYICSRAYLNRAASVATAFMGISGLLLPRSDSAAVSPNGEMLGSVLLLAFWAVLIYRFQGRYWLGWAIGIGTVLFHLKYQLVPQLIMFAALSGIDRRDVIRFLGWLVITCLGVDLIAYRLSGSGIFYQAHSIATKYISFGSVSNRDDFTSIRKHTAGLWQMLQYSPQIIISFLLWLGIACSPNGSQKTWHGDFVASVAMAVTTSFAIMLPGHYNNNYALLFIPTTVFVMTKALRNSGVAR